ncbi:MAG: hypothetical protein U0W24_05980 [Bacteroidales bacterium]
MKFFLFLIVLFCTQNVFCQVVTVESELRDFENSVPELVSKSRRLILQKVLSDDYQRILEINKYLESEIKDKNIKALADFELWLIFHWSKKYNDLLSLIENLTPDIKPGSEYLFYETSFPVYDSLYNTLVGISNISKELLFENLDNSDLQDFEIDFLKLHLEYCLFSSGNSTLTQDSLNFKSDRYLIKYPSSPYMPFIKKFIQFRFSFSKFNMAYDVFIGYGFFKGKISEQLGDYAPIGFSMDLNLRNFVAGFGIGLGVSRLEKTILINNISWEKEMKADIFFPYMSLGYNFLAGKRINFLPYAGISSFILTPDYNDIQSNQQLENISLRSEVSPLFGISINFFGKNSGFNRYSYKPYVFQSVIRIKYTYYQSGFSQDFFNISGQMHTICFSFGGLMKRAYRI